MRPSSAKSTDFPPHATPFHTEGKTEARHWIPTTRSRLPVSVRIAAVTVRAAMRAISPSRRRRYRQYARSRFAMVRTTCRCGTGASNVVSSHWAQMARRFAWQLGQKYRHLQENASRYSWAQASRAAAREAVLEDAAGYSDATSSRGPNYACCCRADHRSARGAASVGPLAAEAGVRTQKGTLRCCNGRWQLSFLHLCNSRS